MSLRVDVATGETVLHDVDLRLSGYIPLELAREYRSGLTTSRPFGHGWRFNLDITLEVGRDAIIHRGAGGVESVFSPVDVGVQATHGKTGVVLQHHPNEFVVYLSPLVQQVFPKSRLGSGVIPIDRVEDPNGNKITFLYSGGRLARVVDSVGRQLHFSYSGDRIQAIHVMTDQGSELVRSFRYDMHGDLVAVQDAGGRESRYTYQGHLMVACTNRLGGTYYAQYDDEGRCVARWCSDGSVVRRFAYDDARQATRVMTTEGHQFMYQNVMKSQVLARTDTEGRPHYYYYDEQQRLTGFALGDGSVPTFQVWKPDEGTRIQIDEETFFVQFQLDERALARQVEDAYGNAYGLAYDERGNVHRLTMPSGATWTFERGPRGVVARVISPEGRSLRLARRSDGRELVVSDALGTCRTIRYDAMGRVVEQIDAAGRSRRLQYDAQGRLTAVAMDGYQMQCVYDAEGRPTTVADSQGRKVLCQYDAFGRVLNWTTEDGQRWQFQYDREGRMARASNGRGGAVLFEYAPLGTLSRIKKSDGSELRTDTEREAAAPVFETGARGEVVSAEVGGEPVTFGYSADGLVESVSRVSDTLTFTYDRDGNLTGALRGDVYHIQLRYDQRNRCTEITSPAGETYRLQYDSADRVQTLSAASEGHFSFEYDALDRLQRRTRDGAVHRMREGEPLLEALSVKGGESTATPVDASQGPGAPWAVLVHGLGGIAILLRFEDLWIPVWVQEALFHRRSVQLSQHIVRACLFGRESFIERLAKPVGLLERWTKFATAGVQGLTEVPTSQDVDLALPVLDWFFLRRMFYDNHYPRSSPFHLPHHQENPDRSSDMAVTGPHMRDVLRPRVWAPILGSVDHSLSYDGRRYAVTPREAIQLSTGEGS